MRWAFSAIAMLALPAALSAQKPLPEVSIRSHPYTPPSDFLRVETNLVETPLTVRDPSGRPIPGLRAPDFEVFDNGAPQTIVAFSELRTPGAATPAPAAPPAARPTETTPPAVAPNQLKFVVFFFDDLHTPNASMQFVKQGARKYIAKGVRAGDYLSIVTASGQGDLDFTNDAETFAERLEHVTSHVRSVGTAACGVIPIDSYIFLHHLDPRVDEEAIEAAMPCAECDTNEQPMRCRATARAIAESAASTTWEQMRNYSFDTLDAIAFGVKRLSEVNGARTLVLTSNGFLVRPNSPPELQNITDAAVRANVTIDAIGAQSLEARMEDPINSVRYALPVMALQTIANNTGGHFYKDTNDLAGAMEQAADPEVSYALAFNAGSADGKFHALKIQLKAPRSGELQYRPGYFSPDPKKKDLTNRARMDDAVFSKKPLHEIPAAVQLAASGTSVHFRIAVDLKNVAFTHHDGRYMQQIAFLTTLLDPTGQFVTGKESIMEFALSDEKLASLKRDGLKATVTLTAAPGAYQSRVIVREGVKGNLAAITTPVEVK